MNDILSRIGLFSIAAFLLYIMKKVDEYHYFKKIEKENESYNFDKDDDDQ